MKIEPGTRVRSKYSEGIGTVKRFWEATEPGAQDSLTVEWDSSLTSGIAVASVDVIPKPKEVARHA